MELHLYSVSKFRDALLNIDELLSVTEVSPRIAADLEKTKLKLENLIQSVEKGATVILIP